MTRSPFSIASLSAARASFLDEVLSRLTKMWRSLRSARPETGMRPSSSLIMNTAG